MRPDDFQIVLKARTTLHSNRGQCLMTMEFWRRAVQDLDQAITIDPLNAKALWRRYKCQRELKDWAKAEADLEALLDPKLQEAAGPLLLSAGLDAAKLAETRQQLTEKRKAAEAEAAETFEDRMEDAAHKGIEALRHRFEEVTQRNGLHGNTELATELAAMITREGGVTTQHVANVYQIDEDDADVLMQWVKKACAMRDEIGYETLDAI